jgi:hypothetical protein
MTAQWKTINRPSSSARQGRRAGLFILACVLAAVVLGALIMEVSRAVVTEGPDWVLYDGDGSSTEFTFSFGAWQTSHVQVVLVDPNGVETVQTENSDYTIAFPNDDGWLTPGGTVTLADAPAATYDVLIRRIVPYEQQSNWSSVGDWDPETLEADLDKSAARDLQLLRQIRRSLRTPDSDLTDMNLPPAAARASTFFGFDANGAPQYTAGIISPNAVSVSPFWATGLAQTTLAATQAYLHTPAGMLNVWAYGAAGDGVTDDTEALTLAAADAAAGGVLWLPPGDYELASDLTTGRQVFWMFCPGATISIADGATLTIFSPGHILAPPTAALFSWSSTGVVAFTAGGEVSAHWWGMSDVGTAAANATALNAALACAFGSYCDLAIWGSEANDIDCDPVGYTNTTGAQRRGITIRGVGRPLLDFSALEGDANAICFEQTAANNIAYSTVLQNLKLVGPEASSNCWNDGGALTTTTGIYADWMLNLKLIDVEVKYFYTGLYTTNSYVRDEGCLVWGCYIGYHLADASTLGYHQCTFDTCYINLYLTGSVYNQTFDNCLLQNAYDGILIEPGAGESCWGLQFINPYFESIDNDALSLGVDLGEADANGSIFGVVVTGGTWSAITGACVRSQTTGNVHGIELHACTGIASDANIVGTIKNSSVSTTSAALGASAVDAAAWYYDENGAIVHAIPTVASHSYGSKAAAWEMTAWEAAASLFIVTSAGDVADANFPVAVPGKQYTVYNNSGQTITFKVAGETGHGVANGKYAVAIMNEDDCVEIYEQP